MQLETGAELGAEGLPHGDASEQVSARRSFAWRVEVATLVSALGVSILLFAMFQLWGTGITERRAQHRLKEQFAKSLAAKRPTTADDPAAPPPPSGSAVAMLNIPKIGLERAVVEGTGISDLRKGPGHYPHTALPGEPGNAAIAGHRTTYGAPFNRLDELQPGDEIFATTRAGKFRYTVTGSKVVRPSQRIILAPTADNRLTLTTCNPKFSAAQRLVVTARLDGPAVVQVANATKPPPAPSKTHTTRWPLAIASLVLLATAWAVLRVSLQRWATHRILVFCVGTPLVLLLLLLAFERIALVLPANI